LKVPINREQFLKFLGRNRSPVITYRKYIILLSEYFPEYPNVESKTRSRITENYVEH